MQKALYHEASREDVRFCRVPFGCNRYSLGRASLMREAAQANAIIRLQNIVLLDIQKLDEHFAGIAGD